LAESFAVDGNDIFYTSAVEQAILKVGPGAPVFE